MAWQDDVSNAFGGFGNGTMPDATNISTQTASQNNNQYQPVDYTPTINRYYADKKDEFNKTLALQQQTADNDYKVKKAQLDQQKQAADLTARTAAERNAIDKWYNEQQVQLAQSRLAQEQQQFTAKLEFDKQVQAENLAFEKEKQAQTFGLAQARQGYDLLSTQAQLRGPQNYYQAAEFARGVGAQPGTATFLDALRNNTNLAGYGAQAGVPDKANVNALAARLGYTGPEIVPGAGSAMAGGGTNDDANLAAIKGIYGAGAQKLGPGSLENLTETERKLLESGIGASGGDWATFLNSYARSRIGQNAGGGNYAAA